MLMCRRHREGSYTSSKPPRPDDKERRYGEERDRSKRYHTIERDRRYDDDRERRERRRGDRHRDRERYERAYRDIDPTRKYGNLRQQRDKDDPRRGQSEHSTLGILSFSYKSRLLEEGLLVHDFIASLQLDCTCIKLISKNESP